MFQSGVSGSCLASVYIFTGPEMSSAGQREHQVSIYTIKEFMNHLLFEEWVGWDEDWTLFPCHFDIQKMSLVIYTCQDGDDHVAHVDSFVCFHMAIRVTLYS